MSITKSYNKQTGIYYAYETTYEWSDEKQKKVQRKRCIGQFDPETGEVIPNGKVGRPSIKKQKSSGRRENSSASVSGKTMIGSEEASKLINRLVMLEAKADELSEEIRGVIQSVEKLASSDI
mgnify:CR=1 FL=1